MQPRHYIPDNFTNARLLFVGWLFICATQCNKTFRALQLFGLKKRNIQFGRNGLRNRITGNRNRTRPNAAFFQKQQVGGPRAHIHYHRAVFGFAFVVAHCITERHRRNIHNLSL